MGMMRLSLSHPVEFLILAVVLLYSVILHETAHGWAALLFGDDTAKARGRLTLNPIPHIDPVGAIMLFLVGFGWAKPVPVNYERLKDSRFGLLCVALAGPLTNILIATAAIFLLSIPGVGRNSVAAGLLPLIAHVNILLGAFNLIPLPPLDGSRILMEFLPEGPRRGFARLDRVGFFLLAFLLLTGLLNPVVNFMQKMVYAAIALFVGGVR
jgi:Zn-dependent protease